MKPLVVLIVTFALSAAIFRLTSGWWAIIWAGNIAMGIMLCFTALGHFMFTKGMEMMMPGFIPAKHFMVLATGFLEVALGIGLVIPSIRFAAGIIAICFFVAILPVNINAAIRHIDHEKATYEGKGLAYLWFRVPLQVLFIAWVYWFSVRQ